MRSAATIVRCAKAAGSPPYGNITLAEIEADNRAVARIRALPSAYGDPKPLDKAP